MGITVSAPSAADARRLAGGVHRPNDAGPRVCDHGTASLGARRTGNGGPRARAPLATVGYSRTAADHPSRTQGACGCGSMIGLRTSDRKRGSAPGAPLGRPAATNTPLEDWLPPLKSTVIFLRQTDGRSKEAAYRRSWRLRHRADTRGNLSGKRFAT
jgi:hypothetical protein